MAKRILVVDDEPQVVTVIKSVLEASGYVVVTAKDGEECLGKIVYEKPHLIVLDIKMPKLDGYSVVAALKQIKSVTKDMPDIPIIVVSGIKDPKIQEMVASGEVEAYLEKPFDVKKLLAAIESVLKNK